MDTQPLSLPRPSPGRPVDDSQINNQSPSPEGEGDWSTLLMANAGQAEAVYPLSYSHRFNSTLRFFALPSPVSLE